MFLSLLLMPALRFIVSCHLVHLALASCFSERFEVHPWVFRNRPDCLEHTAFLWLQWLYHSSFFRSRFHFQLILWTPPDFFNIPLIIQHVLFTVQVFVLFLRLVLLLMSYFFIPKLSDRMKGIILILKTYVRACFCGV